MAEPISLPKGYKRLGAFAIDEDSVFTTQAALDAYLAGGSSYPGQVVALVLDAENEAQIYKVNKDKSLGSIGSVDITIDTEVTENSENAVSGGAVFIALGNKADSNHAHETDAVPTQDSTKLVTSGGVFTELGKKSDKDHTHDFEVTVDAAPTKGSANPVASGAVYKLFKETFKVESTTDTGIITLDETFKVTSITAQDGLTVTIKKSDGTDYTIGDDVAAFDYLEVSGDTLNKVFTVRGEIA